MGVRDERFDAYLAWLAKSLRGGAWRCRAVLPAVDGGLLFALRVEGAGDGVVPLRFVATGPFEHEATFVREEATVPPAVVEELARRYEAVVRRVAHPLLDFRGQDVEEILLRKGGEIQKMWARFLRLGETRWGRFVLREVAPRGGALGLLFSHDTARVRLQVTNADDPRADRAPRHLRVGPLALALLEDTRTEQQRAAPAAAVERFVAYLLAHTTGPRTRLSGQAVSAPDVFLYAKGQQVAQVRNIERQGANGMIASLLGRERRRSRVLYLGDASCRQTLPARSVLRFFDDWSYFPIRTAGSPGAQIAIDFAEAEVIGGAEARLADTLHRLADEGVTTLALVQTCVSRLIGDDVRGVLAERFRPEDVVVLDPDFQHREVGVDALVWQWAFRALRAEMPPPKREAHVNLVGLGHREFSATGELVSLLTSLGMSVGACLFPSFGEDEMAAFDEAALTVGTTSSVFRSAFGSVAPLDDRNQWIYPAPPFGLDGTRDWLAAVAAFALDDAAADAAGTRIEALHAAAREKLEALRVELGELTVAVVAPARFSSFLFEPAELFGVPVIDMVTELGGGVDLLIQADGPLPRDLEDFVDGRERVRLRGFADPDALFEALRASPAPILLSSVRRNRLALDLGKVPLPPSAFEMGFEGALRTARTLRRAATLPLLRSYRAHTEV